MQKLRGWIKRLGGLFSKQRKDQDLEAEIDSHLQMHIDDNLKSGMPPQEARRQAILQLGAIDSTKEACRDQRSVPLLETLWQDLRFGARQLCKNPGFTIVAVLTLALGIGATTAIFSVIYGVLINPYPYSHPEQIWTPGLQSANNRQIMRPFRQDEFNAMASLGGFADMMGTTPGGSLLTGEFAPENITTPRLTSNAFHFIGVSPVLGRTFGPGDFSTSGVPQPVTVITFNLWQRLFGGDPNVLGKTLRFDDQVYTVVGVMPSHFGWWTIDGAWLPLYNAPNDPGRIFPIGRLKPGITATTAREQLQSLDVELAKANPDGFPKESFQATLTNYLDITVASGTMQNALRLLFGAVTFLLLIACANIANLQLARATGRTREMAIRMAIGAGRGRLLRQLVTESVLLSGLGCVLGLALTVAIIRLMVALMPGYYVPAEARIEVNSHVLLFSVSMAVLAGIIFGLVPALQATRPDVAGAMKDERSASVPVRAGAFRSALIIAEMALSVILLICAGLTIRSFLALQNVDPGFRPENVVTADVMLPQSRYKSLDERNRFSQELLERVEKIPGVQSVNIGNGGMPFGGPTTPYSINGQTGPEAKPLTVNLISPDYFKAMGIAFRRGQMLNADNIRRKDLVAVVNEAAAKLWPAGEDPVGRVIHLDILKQQLGGVFMPDNSSADLTVVGICANTHNDGLTSETTPAAFVPYTLVAPPGRTLAIRSQNNSASVLNSVRAELKSMNPQLPLQNTSTIEQAMTQEAAQPRFTMALFSLFAVAGLALATVGLFSVLSYLVTCRTREIGVRMALGAQRGDVLGLILKDGGRLAGLGILVGTIASLGVVRLVGSQLELFKINALDPVSFGIVIGLLCAVALAACWLPARRAARVDPLIALRHE